MTQGAVSDMCQCGQDGEDHMCIDRTIYGPCDQELCGGVCEAVTDCHCDCHQEGQ